MVLAFVVFWFLVVSTRGVRRADRRLRGLDRSASASSAARSARSSDWLPCTASEICVERREEVVARRAEHGVAVDVHLHLHAGRDRALDRAPTSRRSCRSRRTRRARRRCRRTAGGCRTACSRGRGGPGGSDRSGSRSRRAPTWSVEPFAACSTSVLTCWSCVTTEPSVRVGGAEPAFGVARCWSAAASLRLSDARSESDCADVDRRVRRLGQLLARRRLVLEIRDAAQARLQVLDRVLREREVGDTAGHRCAPSRTSPSVFVCRHQRPTMLMSVSSIELSVAMNLAEASYAFWNSTMFVISSSVLTPA